MNDNNPTKNSNISKNNNITNSDNMAVSEPLVAAQPQMAIEGSAKIRLDFLDGLRGLAALYVVLYHASEPAWAQGTLPHSFLLLRKALVYGHFAVAVFIILSGYCLMLPIARSADQQLRGGFGYYIQRRARRILPPYYISVVLSLLLIALVPDLNRPNATYWDGALPAFTPSALLSHLFLVHNLSAQWYFKIDPPLWSVATEWQIYFLFPLVLLPLWRRFGLMAAVGGGILLGLTPHFLLPAPYDIESAAPWYLGLFAIGMGAAVINFARSAQFQTLRARMPWDLLTLVQFALILLFALVLGKLWWANLWFADTQVGLCTATLLISCTERLHRNQSSLVLRIFQARGVLFLGAMSYSLYLMHAPVMALLHIPLANMHMSPALRMVIMLVGIVPCSIAITYLFHLAFERPFLSVQGVHVKKS